MMDQRPEIAVIADLPADLRNALSANFTLVDEPLEGANANAIAIDAISRRYRAIATRAVLGIPAGLIEALPDLGLVLSMGAGLDHIDSDALAARGITLAHTPDQFTEDVADFALGLIYAAQRKIVEADRFCRRDAWPQARFQTSHRVSTRRIGIVGLGRIGQRIAEKCASLGMPVGYYGRTRRAESPHAFHDSIIGLAAASDVLVLACAVTEQTRHIVDRDVLAALGPEGIVVNIARGAVVDEAALIDALQRKTLGGAALDVFASEPDFDPRLLSLDTVILTPHSASFTFEARQAVIDHLLGAARAFFARDVATPRCPTVDA